jgi:uncharacterized LabA/DUF88 family protein
MKQTQKNTQRPVTRRNYAFIDAQNLHQGISAMGWHLDYSKFRKYLEKRFNVGRAFLFMGYMKEHEDVYEMLRSAGFELVYKEVNESPNGVIKGNCDADLVLETMKQLPYYDKAVIVSADGDFCSLLAFLLEHGKLERVLVPSHKTFSFLIEKAADNKITKLNGLKKELAYWPRKKKAIKSS